eukprot:110114-Pyramimonas_sp.AAC.2
MRSSIDSDTMRRPAISTTWREEGRSSIDSDTILYRPAIPSAIQRGQPISGLQPGLCAKGVHQKVRVFCGTDLVLACFRVCKHTTVAQFSPLHQVSRCGRTGRAHCLAAPCTLSLHCPAPAQMGKVVLEWGIK